MEEPEDFVQFTKAIDLVADGKNKLAIYCPQCPKLILNTGVGSYVANFERELPVMTKTLDYNIPDQTEPVKEFFSVDHMFDFSSATFSFNNNGIKFLQCVKCRFGPLGWFDRKSYVVLNRVRYGREDNTKK